MIDDDLIRLLGPPAGDPDDRLRDAITQQTARVVARRRWGRLAGRLATATGLFLAGMAVGRLGAPERVTVVRVEAPAPPAEVLTVPVLVPVSPPPLSPPEDPYRVADRLEQAAERADDRAEAARLYRQAGDVYLTVAAEPGQAERCYKLHLQQAGPAGLAVDVSSDSWLLMSLKHRRKQEVGDGATRGL